MGSCWQRNKGKAGHRILAWACPNRFEGTFSQLRGPDVGEDWRQEEKGMTDGWMASLTRWALSLSKLQETAMDREAWRAAVHGVAKSRAHLSNWTTTKGQELNMWPTQHIHTCLVKHTDLLLKSNMLSLTKIYKVTLILSSKMCLGIHLSALIPKEYLGHFVF